MSQMARGMNNELQFFKFLHTAKYLSQMFLLIIKIMLNGFEVLDTFVQKEF